ncbi:MAG: nucleotidyltransferase family protein [Chloroflexi bacterium]|nr:nucleotidyltransferase family protein [Chloroflexota bacterium]
MYKQSPIALVRDRFALSDDDVASFCLKNHIRRMALFGSIVREDFRPESDVDVLVEFDPAHTPSLFKFSGMRLDLSELLGGKKVDLHTFKGLNKYIRDEVLSEAKVIYDEG